MYMEKIKKLKKLKKIHFPTIFLAQNTIHDSLLDQ